MAYLDMFILLSRYIFVGFMIVFIYISASFIYNMPYKLSKLDKQKTKMQYICIFFFNLAGYSLLIAKQSDQMIRIELIKNGVLFIVIVTITGWILRLTKRSREIPLYNIILFMVNTGIIMLERLNHREASKQIIWCALGLVAAIFIPKVLKFLINPKFRTIYAIAGWVFIITPFFLGKSRNGANNWIMIGEGEGAFGFQPSEIVKVLLVLYLSSSLLTKDNTKTNYKKLLIPMLTAAGYILCLVLQRDLGGGLIFFLTTLTMLYVATSNASIYLLGISSGAMAAIIGYKLFAHVRVRVEAWYDPWKDISGTGYQIVQGLFAIGTWGWFGSGLTRGYPNKIPIVTSDFIFAAICEEFGNLFAIGVILLYLLLVLYGIRVMLRINHDFLILIGIGIINILGIQVILIIGGVIKLIPLTGVTLPFISYGGSSMMVSLLMIGLLQYVADYMEPEIEKDLNE
ncbi:MAG TPA: FtsW/RodA/SpoVE family cell cycle protein [Epulopiscium sp.]|nr:FtsW/RodA/SpoVE family cell cycle protein [Candidatus Epulonipiscium sp.]